MQSEVPSKSLLNGPEPRTPRLSEGNPAVAQRDDLIVRVSRLRWAFPEEPRLPLPFWAWRPGGRLPRLVLLLEPAVDEGPHQGTGRNTASEALAAQARVDAFFEAHRHRLSQGSHLRPQPYTSRPPPATDIQTVMTLGFRGEVLPSIASVSAFSLTTPTGVPRCSSLQSNSCSPTSPTTASTDWIRQKARPSHARSRLRPTSATLTSLSTPRAAGSSASARTTLSPVPSRPTPSAVSLSSGPGASRRPPRWSARLCSGPRPMRGTLPRPRCPPVLLPVPSV